MSLEVETRGRLAATLPSCDVCDHPLRLPELRSMLSLCSRWVKLHHRRHRPCC